MGRIKYLNLAFAIWFLGTYTNVTCQNRDKSDSGTTGSRGTSTENGSDSSKNNSVPRLPDVEGACPTGTMNSLMGIMNSVIPNVPKCIFGPNTINLQLRNPTEALPRINCILKCMLAEMGVFGSDGKFDMTNAMKFFQRLRPEGSSQRGGDGGGLLGASGRQQLEECVLLARDFKPDEYSCRSYSLFFQCIANSLSPVMQRCMMGSLMMSGGGPMRGLLSMFSSLSPLLGMLNGGGGGSLLSMLGGGSGSGAGSGGGGLAGLFGGGNGTGQLLGGDAGRNLVGPLSSLLTGAMRSVISAMSGGMNGVLAVNQTGQGGGQGNLMGAMLSVMMSSMNAMMGRGIGSTGGAGILGMLGGGGPLQRGMTGPSNNIINGTVAPHRSNRSRPRTTGGSNQTKTNTTTEQSSNKVNTSVAIERQQVQPPKNSSRPQLMHSNNTESIVTNLIT